jgi:hypothetical protein
MDFNGGYQTDVPERVCFTGAKDRHLGQLPQKPAAGFPLNFAHDKGRSHQERKLPPADADGIRGLTEKIGGEFLPG